MYRVYLRDLRQDDCCNIVRWRNEHETWKYTLYNGSGSSTLTKELDWFHSGCNRKDVLRFAVCLSQSGIHIGNVYFTDLSETEGFFHIVIGETSYRGRGFGNETVVLAMRVARWTLQLQKVHLRVHEDNIAAIRIYERVGFEFKGRVVEAGSGLHRKSASDGLDKFLFYSLDLTCSHEMKEENN